MLSVLTADSAALGARERAEDVKGDSLANARGRHRFLDERFMRL